MLAEGMGPLCKSNSSNEDKIMVNKLMAFWKDEKGATAVEYGIMVAAIAAVIVTVVFVVGGKVDNAFEAVNTAMNK